MSNLSIKKIIQDAIKENVGPGPDNNVPMSQIYMDIYNKFFNKDVIKDYDLENGPILFNPNEKLAKGEEVLKRKFDNEIGKYLEWENKHKKKGQ